MRKLLCLILFAVASVSIAYANDNTPVISSDAIAAQASSFKSKLGTIECVTLNDKDSKSRRISEAIRFSVTEEPENPWNFSFQIPTEVPIAKDEVLQLRFWARKIGGPTDTGGAMVRPLFEQAGSPYKKSLMIDVEFKTAWTEFSLPFKAVDDYEPGKVKVGFQMGFQKQDFEIAKLSCVSFGKDIDLPNIPKSPMTYLGRESDAPWRKEAEARIDAIRKGPITVVIRDENGQAVPDAEIEIKMTRHSFPWGTAVTTQNLLRQDEDGERYREIVEKYFTRISFENEMKWYVWQNKSKREETFKAIDWLRDRKIDIRGHCLLWPSWKNSPTEYERLSDDPQRLREAVNKRLVETVQSLRGLVVDWDVVNEPKVNNDLMKILGDGEMAEWFKLVRKHDANAKLYINEFSILSANGMDKHQHDHLEKTIRFLQSKGAPITSIGVQSHFVNTVTPPERIKKILDRFADLGVTIAITEHDIATDDELLQADYTRDFFTMVFSHPAVDSVLCWGFWEKSHWRPLGAYFRADWSVKPAGQAWIDLTTKHWWTNEQGKADKSGRYETRGFFGDYEITVRHDGKTKTTLATLPSNGAHIQINLP